MNVPKESCCAHGPIRRRWVGGGNGLKATLQSSRYFAWARYGIVHFISYYISFNHFEHERPASSVPFNPSAGSYRRRRVFGAERGMSFCTSLYCAIAVERRSVSLFSCLAGKFTIVHPRKARLRLQYQVHIPVTRPYGTFHCSQVPGMVDQAFNDMGGAVVSSNPREMALNFRSPLEMATLIITWAKTFWRWFLGAAKSSILGMGSSHVTCEPGAVWIPIELDAASLMLVV